MMNAISYLGYVMLAGYLLASSECVGQRGHMGASSKTSSISVGLTAGHYRYDPALGIEATSPGIIISNLRLRVRASRTWLEQYKAINDRWITYYSYWAGLTYNINAIERAKVFIEAGSYSISPNKVFSSEKFHTGGYASIGVELFVTPDQKEKLSYFFSGGFASIYAHADKMEGHPRYGSGMIFTNGLRYYFFND